MASDFNVAAEDAQEAAEFAEQARDAFGEDRATVALPLIDRSLELDPTSFDAWSLKAKILVRLEHGPQALEAVDRALTIVPNDYDALAEKSGILSMFADDLEGGLRIAQQAYAAMTAAVAPAQRSDPDGPDFWAVETVYDNLYYALYRLGRREEAAKIREEAASFGHEFAEGVEDDDSSTQEIG
jgi:tetratricopeptide (TPR) repeat protein